MSSLYERVGQMGAMRPAARQGATMQATAEWQNVSGISEFDIQQYLLRQVLGGNFGAPITRRGVPNEILDLGCGRGHWAREMAILFPQTRVISLDLCGPSTSNSTSSSYSMRSENFGFVYGNPYDRLPFADQQFDFTHMHRSTLFPLLPASRWPALLNDCTRVTRPGGWIEITAGLPPSGGGPALESVVEWVSEACSRCGIDARHAELIGDIFGAAGLRSVTTEEVLLALGRPGGWVGGLLSLHCFSLLEGLWPLVAAHRLTTAEVYFQALAAARLSVDQGEWPCVFPLRFAFGQV